MAFKMKGHTLPGPYQKQNGDPKNRLLSEGGGPPEKMDKIQPEPLISPAEHAKNIKGYYNELTSYKGRVLPSRNSPRLESLKKPSGWSASGMPSSESGHRRKDIAASASTVDKRFSTAKDKKSLKRPPLKKKGDPKKGRNYSKKKSREKSRKEVLSERIKAGNREFDKAMEIKINEQKNKS